MSERYSIIRSPACLEALAAGRTKFTADEPCFRKHAPIRYTNTGVCVECMRMRQAKTKAPRKVRAVAAPAPIAMPGLTLQFEVPAHDVHCLQVCAALLAHPDPARSKQMRTFLANHDADVRGPLPGVVLKRI